MIGVANDKEWFLCNLVQKHELHDLQSNESLSGSRWTLDHAKLVAERAPDSFKLSIVQDCDVSPRPSSERTRCLRIKSGSVIAELSETQRTAGE